LPTAKLRSYKSKALPIMQDITSKRQNQTG
jgi:hypothetical protein